MSENLGNLTMFAWLCMSLKALSHRNMLLEGEGVLSQDHHRCYGFADHVGFTKDIAANLTDVYHGRLEKGSVADGVIDLFVGVVADFDRFHLGIRAADGGFDF